jgi:Kef-type K+ transport system membrane component KefB
MGLKDLSRVGGGALRVAAIGVIAPMALAYPVVSAMGLDRLTALFLAAGITATSVGITARVFGDLRMLASPEASTVLGLQKPSMEQ